MESKCQNAPLPLIWLGVSTSGELASTVGSPVKRHQVTFHNLRAAYQDLKLNCE
jgi:hypothetical protein